MGIELWVAGQLGRIFGAKVAAIAARVFVICLMVAIVVGPYIVIYQKLSSSEAKMADVKVQLAQEAGKRENLERDLKVAQSEAEGIRQDMESLGRSLDTLNSRYAASVARVTKLERFLHSTDFAAVASKNPAEAEQMINATIKELWNEAETVTGRAPVHH